jgi:hypothetical protein
MSWRGWTMVSLVAVVLAGGCGVSPAMQARLDKAVQAELEASAKVLSLGAQLAQLAAEFQAGKLEGNAYGLAREKLASALTEAKESALNARLARIEAQDEAKREGVSGWTIAGALLGNLVLRLVGVPGFASASGGSLVTVAKGLASKARNGD